jgi:hypothetical protein
MRPDHSRALIHWIIFGSSSLYVVQVGVENSKVAAWLSEMLVVTPPGTTSIALIPRGFIPLQDPRRRREQSWLRNTDRSNGKHPLERKLTVMYVCSPRGLYCHYNEPATDLTFTIKPS